MGRQSRLPLRLWADRVVRPYGCGRTGSSAPTFSVCHCYENDVFVILRAKPEGSMFGTTLSFIVVWQTCGNSERSERILSDVWFDKLLIRPLIFPSAPVRHRSRKIHPHCFRQGYPRPATESPLPFPWRKRVRVRGEGRGNIPGRLRSNPIPNASHYFLFMDGPPGQLVTAFVIMIPAVPGKLSPGNQMIAM